MQQNVGRIDHITFIYRPENLDSAVDQFTKALDIHDWDGPKHFEEAGIIHAQSVLAGIELIAPTTDEGLYADYLREHGEGLWALIFGVADLDKSVSQALANGAQAVSDDNGAPMIFDAMTAVDGKPAYESWNEKYQTYREVLLKPVAGINLYLGQCEPRKSGE